MAKENTIAIVNVSSTDKDMAQFIADELEYLLVNGGFTVVDRGLWTGFARNRTSS